MQAIKNVNTAKYWDERWNKNSTRIATYTANRIASLIPYGDSVLDIGCGRGKFLRMIEFKCVGYGIDISPVAIKKLKEEGFDGEVWNAENLTGFNKKFDVVVSAHLLEHLENEDRFLNNVARIANKFAILAVPTNIVLDDIGEHLRNYTKEGFKKLLGKYFKNITDHSLRNHIIFKCYPK